MNLTTLMQAYVFVLAGFVGFLVIARVPPLLHTPLMSATNAISGISLVGSLVAAGAGRSVVSTVLGTIAVTAATINVVGGFIITRRMLGMFKRSDRRQSGAPRSDASMREALVQASYLLASVLFILSLKSLSRADTAARGVDLAVAGMAIAIIGTLMQQTIVDYRWIALGLGVGTVVGIPLGTRVPMTAMPQRIAIALTFGASAATLVGIAEYHDHRETLALGQRIAVAFEVVLGSLTVAGSFVAAGKLQEMLPSRPLTYRGRTQ